MKQLLIRCLAIGVLMAPAACSSQEKPPQAAAGGTFRGVAALLSVTFAVEAVDAQARTITLKGPQGNVSTFRVGEGVKRLSEIKPGDAILVQYHVGVAAELREPTAQEKATPIQVMESTARAPSDVPAAVSLTRTVKVVTTVDAVDRAARTVTLKGPQGNELAFKVEDPSSLDGLKIGQPVISVFGERLVLAVEPGSRNP